MYIYVELMVLSLFFHCKPHISFFMILASCSSSQISDPCFSFWILDPTKSVYTKWNLVKFQIVCSFRKTQCKRQWVTENTLSAKGKHLAELRGRQGPGKSAYSSYCCTFGRCTVKRHGLCCVVWKHRTNEFLPFSEISVKRGDQLTCLGR